MSDVVYKVAELHGEIHLLQGALDDATAKLGRLLSAARCYCDAPSQIKGEAFSDLAATVQAIDSPELERYGWPMCYARVESKLDEANAVIATAQRLLECVDLDDEADQADYERVMAWGVKR